MAAKRKYARMGENSEINECTNRKCKWQGKDEEKASKRISQYMTEDICPKCGNNSFFGLIINEQKCSEQNCSHLSNNWCKNCYENKKNVIMGVKNQKKYELKRKI